MQSPCELSRLAALQTLGLHAALPHPMHPQRRQSLWHGGHPVLRGLPAPADHHHTGCHSEPAARAGSNHGNPAACLSRVSGCVRTQCAACRPGWRHWAETWRLAREQVGGEGCGLPHSLLLSTLHRARWLLSDLSASPPGVCGPPPLPGPPPPPHLPVPGPDRGGG